MSKKKLVVTDMDDTLIKAYGKPTDAVVSKWNSLFERDDMIVVIATGQQYVKVKNVMFANDMKLPHYILGDQGTVIFDTRNNGILDYFTLPNENVKDIVAKFFDLGGKKEFIRICTSDIAIAYNSEISKEFFKKTSQNNVLLVEDLSWVLENGQYSKLILMDKPELVDNLVMFSSNNNALFAVNTGKTSYGKCDFYRFEVISVDKRMATSLLLRKSENFPENEHNIDVLCLGDERADYGLAQFALSMNLFGGSSGQFSIIKSGTVGNEQLMQDCRNLATSLGLNDKVILEEELENDGWIKAIDKWLEKVE